MKKPLSPRPCAEIMQEVFNPENLNPRKAAAILSQGPLAKGKYRHWDRLRHLAPPDDLTSEEWWLGIKLARQKLYKTVPLKDKHGEQFVFSTPDPVERNLHHIAQHASGRILAMDQITNPNTRDRYLISSLIEEAITSSQLEGAVTTSDVAKNMLRTGRPPRDRSEQMIINNYLAMQYVRDYQDEPLTTDLILELHDVLTRDTLDEPDSAGTFRTAADDIVVQQPVTGEIYHRPPPAAELPERMEVLCRFANSDDSGTFIHPVIRAVIVHFCIGYDHPFVDGNGRTARALFYWAMLRHGYWLAQYLSISRILTAAPSRYAMAYLYTETDENDLTYFLDHQTGVIVRSIAELHDYLDRKMKEIRALEALVKEAGNLNHRQVALLGHALRHPGSWYTIESHRRSHDVVYQTARTDLLDLASRGLLSSSKRARAYRFTAPSDLSARLHALSRRRREVVSDATSS